MCLKHICDKNLPCVYKGFFLPQDPLSKDQFFDSKLEKATRVIWINAKSVGVIEAKLRVYRIYKKYLRSTDILLHHSYEDIDDILKSSARQRLLHLYRSVASIKENILLESIETIIKDTTQESLSEENILKTCCAIKLQDDNDNCRKNVTSAFVLPSKEDLSVIVRRLIETTLNATAKTYDLNISENIFNFVKSTIQQYSTSDCMDEKTLPTILTDSGMLVSLADALNRRLSPDFLTVNIKSPSFKPSVAYEIYKFVSKEKELLMQEHLQRIKKKFQHAARELESLLHKIDDLKIQITIPNPKTCKFIFTLRVTLPCSLLKYV